MKFIDIVCAAFLARVKPVSTIAKPACMNITRKPVSSVHTMLIETLLWPTVSITSTSVGCAASLTGTSAALPVAAPVGSGPGAGVCCAQPAERSPNTASPSAAPSKKLRTNRLLPVLKLHVSFPACSPVARAPRGGRVVAATRAEGDRVLHVASLPSRRKHRWAVRQQASYRRGASRACHVPSEACKGFVNDEPAGPPRAEATRSSARGASGPLRVAWAVESMSQELRW